MRQLNQVKISADGLKKVEILFKKSVMNLYLVFRRNIYRFPVCHIAVKIPVFSAKEKPLNENTVENVYDHILS